MKSRFTTQLQVANIADGTKRLIAPLVYESRIAGRIEVPVGTRTDLATFRVGNLALRGKTEEPAVVHDYLYSMQTCTRAQADDIFNEALAAKGVRHPRRAIYWLAVRLFGWAAWNSHKRKRK